MKRLIFYKCNNVNEIVQVFDKEEVFYEVVDSLRELIGVLVRITELHGLFFCEGVGSEEFREICEVVWIVHPHIKIMTQSKIDENCDFLVQHKNKIHYLESFEEIKTVIDFELQYVRKYHRVEWPLKAFISKEENLENLFEGKIISLSAGGMLVMVHSDFEFAMNSPLFSMISFRDFKFFVESHLIRKDYSSGDWKLAMEFQHVSDNTRRYIDYIVKDKIASQLLIGVD